MREERLRALELQDDYGGLGGEDDSGEDGAGTDAESDLDSVHSEITGSDDREERAVAHVRRAAGARAAGVSMHFRDGVSLRKEHTTGSTDGSGVPRSTEFEQKSRSS